MSQNNNYIAIPSLLKVEKDALSKIGTYLKDSGFQKVVIFFGNGLIDMFGTTVMQSLKDANIEVLEYSELDTVRLEDITSLASAFQIKPRQSSGLAAEK